MSDLRDLPRPDALITSDIEIRDYSPKCRTDDFVSALDEKLTFIRELADVMWQVPVLDGGDLFDKRYRSHPSHALLKYAMRVLPETFVTVPGNHDLPSHAIENFDRSAMAVLEEAEVIKVANPETPIRVLGNLDHVLEVYGFPYRLPQTPPKITKKKGTRYVALVHAMVYKGKPPFPGCDGHEARDLLVLLSEFDLVICGHNHQSFIEDRGQRLLVNPGSLMRADSNQMDYRPRIFAYYAGTNSVIPIEVPIREGVVSRVHLDVEESRNERLEAFLSKIGADVEDDSVSFRQTLSQILAAEGITEQVKEKVWQYLDATD